MPAPDVLTLTLNPTVDMYSIADAVVPTNKIRTHDETMRPGGGGVNVARVLDRLGTRVEALYLSGGASGQVLDALLVRERLPVRRIAIAGDTRLSLTVRDRSTDVEYRFVPEGPCASAAELDQAMQEIAASRSEWLVLSGSLPRDAPDDLYARMISAAGWEQRVVLDSSGEELRLALATGRTEMVKPSRNELEAITGLRLDNDRSLVRAARQIIERGDARCIAVSSGRDGAVLVDERGGWRLDPLPVRVTSSVGAGDSFVAGMIAALSAGADRIEAFRWGMAAGAATVATPGSNLCDRKGVEAMLENVGAPEPVAH